MTGQALPPLVSERLTEGAAGVTSVCSAHPLVIEAALLHSARAARRVLIEATCNQVNQEGGYTGMTPADFRGFVETIASRIGFDPSGIVLGGDHLGPNPWKGLPAEEALARAEAMVAAYARAGFSKIHLDASMGCAGEPASVPDSVAAQRAARLAEVAEAVGLRDVDFERVPRAARGRHLRADNIDDRARRAGRRPRNDRGARESVPRARPRGRVRTRHRPGGAARRRIRRIRSRTLRSGEGAAALGGPGRSAAVRVRGAFHGLPDARGAGGAGRRRLRYPEGRAGASMFITYETSFRSMLSLTNTIMPPRTDVDL